MPAFVVAHRHALVSYVVAAALRICYGRGVGILIVEVFSHEASPSRSGPWCGASTVSNHRISQWALLRDLLLAGVLANSVMFLDSIHIKDPGDAAFGPRSGPWQQRLRLTVRQGAPASSLAVFYHPEMVVSALKQFLLGCANVSFTSVWDPEAIPMVVKQMLFKSASVVVVNFLAAGHRVPTDMDVLVNSRLSSVEGTSAGLPSAVLWLPLFRGAAGMFGEAIFTSSVTQHENVVEMRVGAMNMNPADLEFAQRFDLLYAVKACDYVLGSIGLSPGVVRL